MAPRSDSPPDVMILCLCFDLIVGFPVDGFKHAEAVRKAALGRGYITPGQARIMRKENVQMDNAEIARRKREG